MLLPILVGLFVVLVLMAAGVIALDRPTPGLHGMAPEQRRILAELDQRDPAEADRVRATFRLPYLLH